MPRYYVSVHTIFAFNSIPYTIFNIKVNLLLLDFKGNDTCVLSTGFFIF